MSAAFDRFRFSFFIDGCSSRDGLDVAALCELDGAERTQAETMLLASLPDTRCVIGLGAMGSERALRPLQFLLNVEAQAWRAAASACRLAQKPTRMIETARALWLIRPDQRCLKLVLEVLEVSYAAAHRADAALALEAFRSVDAVPALVRALDDCDALVRYHAARTLFAIHGLDCESKDPEHALYQVMADDLARREKGKAALLETLAAVPTRLGDRGSQGVGHEPISEAARSG